MRPASTYRNINSYRESRPFFRSSNQCGRRLQKFFQYGSLCEKFANPWHRLLQPAADAVVQDIALGVGSFGLDSGQVK